MKLLIESDDSSLDGNGVNSISTPSVVVGKHKVNYPSGLPIITIPCITDKGEMFIEIALKVNNA